MSDCVQMNFDFLNDFISFNIMYNDKCLNKDEINQKIGHTFFEKQSTFFKNILKN